VTAAPVIPMLPHPILIPARSMPKLAILPQLFRSSPPILTIPCPSVLATPPPSCTGTASGG
jgi:hypothetical protein